jgi:hypothetical protein
MFRFAGAALLLGTALGSFDTIGGYLPETDVVPHSKIDLDMQEINSLLGQATGADFTSALFVYENGGNGKCTQALIDAATAYGAPATSGACFGNAVDDPVGNSLKSDDIRTLKGFATSGKKKMSAEYWYNIYKNYWASTGMAATDAENYADTNVRAAFAGTGAFAGASDNMRKEVAKKGVAYQANWMYVLHEFEDAIMDCLMGDIFENDKTTSGNSPHAWDEGWAFYAGSLEGKSGNGESGDGVMLMKLANKRCKDFGTCASGTTGEAKVNTEALRLAELGRDKILVQQCDTVQEEFDKIVDQMTIPLIQGMLKYAYKSDPARTGSDCAPGASLDLDTCDKAVGEGWAFASAVLPRLNMCDSDVAKMVKDNLDVTAITGATTQTSPAPVMGSGYAAFKTEVEKTYPCLGITCTHVGEFQSSSGVYPGMEKCTDGSASSATVANPEVAGAAADTFDLTLANRDWKPIAGYNPSSSVVAHAKVDLDMEEIESFVKTEAGMASALFVYEKGGNGKCTQAQIDAATAFGVPESSGACYQKTTTDPVGNSLKSDAVRNLKDFATSGEGKMSAEYFYNLYKNYWASAGGYTKDQAKVYADTFVRDAMKGTGEYATASIAMKEQVVKKGIAYHAVWMYVLHEYEDAIFDCLKGDITGNDANVGGAAPHAWDEGWAFYAGSLETETASDGSTGGVMVYKLASKRGKDFGTCAGGTTGLAKANLKHLALARNGRDKILAGDCFTVTKEFDAIVDQMTIPLVQGMLKYAYKADPANGKDCASAGDGCDKSWAEGWAFAGAVLPRLHYCDASRAKMVKENLDVTTGRPHMKDGYAKIKAEVECLYECLGITCEEVGAFQTSAGVYAGMEACTDAAVTARAACSSEVTDSWYTLNPATTAAPTSAPTVDAQSGAVMAAFAMAFLSASI